MKNRGVLIKLMWLVGASVVAFVGLGLYGISNTSSTFHWVDQVYNTAEDFRAGSQQITNPLNELRQLSLSIVMAPNPTLREGLLAKQESLTRQIDRTFREWDAANDDPEEAEAFRRLEESWDHYKDLKNHTVERAQSRYREEAFINAIGAEQEQFDVVNECLTEWRQTKIANAEAVYREAIAQQRRVFWVSSLVVLLMTLLVASIGIFITRSIVRPIQVLKAAATRIANRESVESIDVHSKDELGELARDMEGMAAATQAYVAQQQQAEAEVRALNAQLEQRVEERTAELKHATETLRREAEERKWDEERYRSLVEATTAVVWNTPASGEFESEQLGWSTFTGQSFNELKGWGWLDAVHPDDRPNTAAVWSSAVANRSLYEVEHRLRRHDGTYRHMLVRAVPILGDDGAIREWVGIHTDIDPLKRAEAAQRDAKEAAEASAAWAELVVDTAFDAFVVMDEQGRITGWNKQAEATFGWSREETVGRSLSETIIPPEFREAHERGLKHFLETGEGQVLNRRIEVTALNREGHCFPIEVAIRPIREGESYVFSAFMHDITARKKAEAALREAKESAESANKAKSEFLANMSHEIRTPMNGIIGMTELALDTKLATEQREYLEMVKSSADYLLAVINDILDFSKIEAGKLDLDPIDFNLREHLDDTVTTLALRAHTKGLELACHVLADVPDALVGDPGRLRQIIVNLIGNAVKFTGEGEVVVRVEKQEQTENDVLIHFRVKDTGIGIPSEKLGTLFQAFSQVDTSTTRKYGGTGLGLAISSQLVKMMGGRIWVESAEGRGSTFHFTARFGLSKTPAPRQVPPELSKIKGLPILVVDDNATNRRILQELLANWRLKPTVVSSGSEALAAMQKARHEGEPFAIVLLDNMMPEMDGFMLAEEILKRPDFQGSTMMMLSSADRHENAERCRELGVTAYMSKPVKRADLLNAIVTAVDADPAKTSPQGSVSRPGIASSDRVLQILLTEDNAVNQKLAVRLLEKRGHQVVVARNGKVALEALSQHKFDVVLMDVQMPEMDGFEATRTIRERERETGERIPIIAMTAHAMKGDRERCLEAGMDGYVSKPLQPSKLIEAVEGFTRRRPREQPASATTPAHAAPVVERTGPAFDKVKAMETVGGDFELAKEIIEAFLEESPRLMDEIRDAIAEGDAKSLGRAAHSLKGAASALAAAPVSEAAQRLETMGKDDKIIEAEQAYATLQHALEELKPQLLAFSEESALWQAGLAKTAAALRVHCGTHEKLV